MVRKWETGSGARHRRCLRVGSGIVLVVCFIYFPVWRESEYNVDSSHLIHIDLSFGQLRMSFHHQGAEAGAHKMVEPTLQIH